MKKKILNNSYSFLLYLFIIIFFTVTILTIKAFYLRHQLKTYGMDAAKIIEKSSNNILAKADVDREFDVSYLKKIAASSLVSCINSSIDVNELPENINKKITEINNYMNSNKAYFSYKYVDIYTGFYVEYNANQQTFAASTIKAPVDLYIYDEASKGNIDLKEKLTYTSKYYNQGTGILKNTKFNKQYDIKTLVSYSAIFSDNAAHNMMVDRFGKSNIKKYWTDLGATSMFNTRDNWGNLNANDAALYMKKIYDFYVSDENYGNELMDNFISANFKLLNGNGYTIANKTGWNKANIHDMGIVFAENPYVVVALSHLGQTSGYTAYFKKISKLTSELHKMYWEYKIDSCNKIKQY